MWKYILKRILALIPVIVGVTFIVFTIMSMAPGDPAKTILGEQATPEDIAAKRLELGLDDPLLVQYGRYMFKLVQGDMGDSYKTKTSVATEVMDRFPNTLIMSLCACVIAIVLSIPLGIMAAVKQNTFLDGASMFVALVGVSMPIFWLAMLLILFFSVQLGWLPSSGSGTWKHLVLPSVALGFMHMAAIARTTRSSMLEVIRQDYIRTARSKGVPERVIIRKHALQNALIPTVTVIGLQVGGLLGGSVLTETVFAWPGVGRYMIQSIQGRDIPSVLGCIIIFTLCFSIVNLAVDLTYGFIDPRIKAQFS